MRTSLLGKVLYMPSKYDPETRARAVRLVREHCDGYPSEWAAITAVSKRLGMTAETLRSWIASSRSMTVIVMGCPARRPRRFGLSNGVTPSWNRPA